jgi:hypothetical protein
MCKFILIIPIKFMFITRKKFKRKKGTVTFYYVLKSIKKDGKFKLKNETYLGDVYRIMKVVKVHNKGH